MFHFKKNKRSHAMHEGRERVLHLKEGCGKTRSTFQSRERERERFARGEGRKESRKKCTGSDGELYCWLIESIDNRILARKDQE